MEYFIVQDDIELLVESQRRNICEELVEELKNKRIERGMSQQDISNITGIKRPNIARIEACTATPTFDVLVKYATALGYKLKFFLEEDEIQRVGRNKDTAVNSSYISSGEYQRKFDNITSSESLNRLIYQKAKEMLEHRSGTEYEDMYWIDISSENVICNKLDETNIREIRHTKIIEKKLKLCDDIFAIHTHPHSMPPSVEDFNSFIKAGYKVAIVICHDGTVYRYGAINEISEQLMTLYINKFYLQTEDEKLAQLMAIDRFIALGDIYCEEIKA